jgi:hypothetical protein
MLWQIGPQSRHPGDFKLREEAGQATLSVGTLADFQFETQGRYLNMQ